jgi:hypothetical protein
VNRVDWGGIDRQVPAVVLKLARDPSPIGRLAAVRSLGRLGIDVYAVQEPHTPSARSRYGTTVPWPLATQPPEAELLDRLLGLGEALGDRPVLYATDEIGSRLLDTHGDRLISTFRFPRPPAQVLNHLGVGPPEFMPGVPAPIWVFNGYFDAMSECRASFTGRTRGLWHPSAGAASVGVCQRNRRLVDISCRLMQSLGGEGIIDMIYRYDAPTDRYELLDVTPRLSTTVRLFVGDNGMDVVRAMYLNMTGQAVPAAENFDGRTWAVEPFNGLGDAENHTASSLTWREWATSLRRASETGWFAADDPLPFVSVLARSTSESARAVWERFRVNARGLVGPGSKSEP